MIWDIINISVHLSKYCGETNKFVGIVMFIKISRCPHYNGVLKFGTSNMLDNHDPLGAPSYFNCPSCTKPISTGKREWADMSSIQKAIYISRLAIGVVLFSFLIIFFSIIIFGEKISGPEGNLNSVNFYLYVVFVFMVLSLITIFRTMSDIKKSNTRGLS